MRSKLLYVIRARTAAINGARRQFILRLRLEHLLRYAGRPALAAEKFRQTRSASSSSSSTTSTHSSWCLTSTTVCSCIENPPQRALNEFRQRPAYFQQRSLCNKFSYGMTKSVHGVNGEACRQWQSLGFLFSALELLQSHLGMVSQISDYHRRSRWRRSRACVLTR